MEKSLWAKRVIDKLHGGERNIDTAIRSLTELMNEVQDAQGDLNVSAVATNPSLAKIMEAMMSLQEARTHLTASHHRLDKLGKVLQMRTTSFSTPLKISPDEQETRADTAQAV